MKTAANFVSTELCIRRQPLDLVDSRVRPVPDPAEKPQPFSAVGLLLTRTRQADNITQDPADL